MEGMVSIAIETVIFHRNVLNSIWEIFNFLTRTEHIELEGFCWQHAERLLPKRVGFLSHS